MSNYPKSSNPFEDEEADNFTILNKPDTSNGSRKPYDGGGPDGRRQQLWEDANDYEDRQLESTRRALASIYDSERVGIATAEELIHQGEILDNVETKTGNINQNLKTSQKHLTSIKSVFGGIKNWWNGAPTSEGRTDPVSSPRKLQQTVDNGKIEASSSRPPNNLRSGDISGFYDESEDLDYKFLAGSSQKYTGANERMFQPVTNTARETEIDQNLSIMSDGMSRLKGLASGLGNEIDAQNEQLDRINRKVDIADHNVEMQTKQMKKLLK